MKPPIKLPTKRGAPPPPPKGKGDAGGPTHGIAIIIAPSALAGAPGNGGKGFPPKGPKAPPPSPAAQQKAGIRKSLNAAYKQQTKK